MKTFAVGTLLLAVALGARSVEQGAPASLVGTWRGTSICTDAGKPACHDEVVVYHFIAATDSSANATRVTVEHLGWQMNKVVAGAEEEMGKLGCDYVRESGATVCPMRDWSWRFRARGDTLRGTLANPTGVVWRNIVVARVK
jgi:hypothetical protein